MKALGAIYEPNALYPEETFVHFISTRIAAKKRVIKQVLATG